MFQLTKKEFDNLRSQNAASSWGGRRTLPYVFTEHGILMLANVLKSNTAIQISIRIIEVFVKIREMFLTFEDIIERLSTIEGSLTEHEEMIIKIYRYMQQLEAEKKMQANQIQRNRIGYKTREDETSEKSGNQ